MFFPLVWDFSLFLRLFVLVGSNSAFMIFFYREWFIFEPKYSLKNRLTVLGFPKVPFIFLKEFSNIVCRHLFTFSITFNDIINVSFINHFLSSEFYCLTLILFSHYSIVYFWFNFILWLLWKYLRIFILHSFVE